MPTQQSLTRTVFWTFWVLTVALTAHAASIDFFGIGIWLRDFSWPKTYMRGEIRVAEVLTLFTGIGLTVTSIRMARWSRRLRLLGFLVVGMRLFYFDLDVIPRV